MRALFRAAPELVVALVFCTVAIVALAMLATAVVLAWRVF